MRVSQLDFPDEVKSIFRSEGIEELNPPQRAAVKPLMDGRNLVVASPTASGKTFIAELAVLKNFFDGHKTIYLVPLKALASEKYDDFRKYEQLGMRVAISLGDMDSASDYLGKCDLIVMSNEKADSLIRHGAGWLDKVRLVVSDEIHLINDARRGPALEVVLTRLRDRRIIALSATINNAQEVADWLGAHLVRSDYRPVQLHTGVAFGGEVDFGETKKRVKPSDEVGLSADAAQLGKQALVFVATRRSAEAAAEKVGKAMKRIIDKDTKDRLENLAAKVEGALSHRTKQCRRLAKCVRMGTAFHHAGLVAKQRRVIENAFRAGALKSIAATTTLAYGMNLPAYRVVVRDTKRWGSYGSEYIPTLEVHQCFGRAGRPRYDDRGEAVLVAKSENQKEKLVARYIEGEPEPIYSKLSVEPVLRMHTLALIATGVEKKSELEDFFAKTFFAHQYEDISEVMSKVGKILKQLSNYGFIRVGKDGFISDEFVPAFDLNEDVPLKATPLGRRVSQLYIDPLSAHRIIENMSVDDDDHYMTVLNSCVEMYPLPRVRKNEWDDVEEKLAETDVIAPDIWEVEYDDFLRAFKGTLILGDWMNEAGEDRILEKWKVTPGELYSQSKNMEWVLYAAKEIALIRGNKEAANRFNRLRLRVKHGVRDELLKLVRVRGIGRVRARLLFHNGIKSRRDIKFKGRKVADLLGPKVAENILKDVK